MTARLRQSPGPWRRSARAHLLLSEVGEMRTQVAVLRDREEALTPSSRTASRKTAHAATAAWPRSGSIDRNGYADPDAVAAAHLRLQPRPGHRGTRLRCETLLEGVGDGSPRAEASRAGRLDPDREAGDGPAG